jgi:hypothetical protein
MKKGSGSCVPFQYRLPGIHRNVGETMVKHILLLGILVTPACKDQSQSQSQDLEAQEICVIAKRLLEHLTFEELGRSRIELEPLLMAGVLLESDGEIISRNHFQSFRFSRSPYYARQYAFVVYYEKGHREGGEGIRVEVNHLGERVRTETGEQDKCTNIVEDIKLMWSVVDDGIFEGWSTQESVYAASRVFNTLKVVGMNRNEIISQIGDTTRRPNGKSNGSFFPTDIREMVYSFNRGNGGWEFHLEFNEQGMCTKLRRLQM